MEEVFDFRAFVLGLLRRWKALLIPFIVLGLIGGGVGFIRAGRAGEEQPNYTATAAASVKLIDQGEIPYWTLSGIMATVEAVSASDFTYANFADELAEQGLSQVLGGAADPGPEEIKQSVRFYIRGNLLLTEVTTHSQELSTQASQAGVNYLAEVLPSLISHIQVEPLDRQTVSMTVTPAPSKLRKAVKYGALGGAAGLVLGFLWIFCVDVFDPRLRSARDLERFGLPVLGAGPEDGRSRRAAIGLLGALKGQRPALAAVVTPDGDSRTAEALVKALKALGEDAVCAPAPAASTAPEAAAAMEALRSAHGLTLVPLSGDADLLLMAAGQSLPAAGADTRLEELSRSLELLRALGAPPLGILYE